MGLRSPTAPSTNFHRHRSWTWVQHDAFMKVGRELGIGRKKLAKGYGLLIGEAFFEAELWLGFRCQIGFNFSCDFVIYTFSLHHCSLRSSLGFLVTSFRYETGFVSGCHHFTLFQLWWWATVMPKAGSKRCSGCWKTGASDLSDLGARGIWDIWDIPGKVVHISLEYSGKKV